VGKIRKNMALFKKKAPAKKAKKLAKKSGRSSDAKAILAKMNAKKDAGDCPFC